MLWPPKIANYDSCDSELCASMRIAVLEGDFCQITLKGVSTMDSPSIVCYFYKASGELWGYCLCALSKILLLTRYSIASGIGACA